MAKIKSAVVILLYIAFAGCAGFVLAASGATLAANDGKGDMNIIAVIPYTVMRGDNLTHVAARFKVRISDILTEDLNPNLVARNNPNLIYRGEAISIPVHAKFAVLQPASRVVIPATPPPVEPQGVQEVKKKPEAVQGRINQETLGFLQAVKSATWLPVALLAVAVLLGIIALFRLDAVQGMVQRMKAGVGLQKDREPIIKDTDHIALYEAIRHMKADEVVKLLNVIVVHDEQGNGVQLKNFAEFLKKRPYYGRTLLNQFADAMGGGVKDDDVNEAVRVT